MKGKNLFRKQAFWQRKRKEFCSKKIIFSQKYKNIFLQTKFKDFFRKMEKNLLIKYKGSIF